ncbi:CRAL/TRIO domain-containing protein [Armillaria nabsnona]|nr:CRAL/TRIO domain-containing protein [Armillaria nabsnona]
MGDDDHEPRQLQVFKDSLVEVKLYRPATEIEKASHSDVTLLRFLRARRFDISKAQKQFSDTEAWRKKHDVDRLFATFDDDEFELTKRFYPQWTGRRDKDGNPLYVYHIASLAPIQKELDAVSHDRRYQRIVVLYEAMARLVLPVCTHINPTRAISSCTTIIDLSSLTLGTVISLRSHLQEASRLATANYPETLHIIAVVNAPAFFPMIWGWIKGWFDEGTRNKIYILGKGTDMGKLEEIVDREHIPKVYGGELEWVYGDAPSLDDAVKDVMAEIPWGPAEFIDGVVDKKDPVQHAVSLS